MAKLINVKYLSFDDIFAYNGIRFQLKGVEYDTGKSANVKLHAVNLSRNTRVTLETVTSASMVLEYSGEQ